MSTYIEHNAVTPDGVLVTDGHVHLTRPYTELKLKVVSGGSVDGKKTFTLKTGESAELKSDGEAIVIQLAKLDDEQKSDGTDYAVEVATKKAEHAVSTSEELDENHNVVEKDASGS